MQTSEERGVYNELGVKYTEEIRSIESSELEDESVPNEIEDIGSSQFVRDREQRVKKPTQKFGLQI